MEKLCPDCKVIYQNADADAAQQQQQFNSVISQGAKVDRARPGRLGRCRSLVKPAQSQGVKVIAYDRPIPTAGRLLRLLRQREDRQGDRRSLVEHLKAPGRPPKGGRPADQRLADRRGRRPDQEGHPRGPRQQRLSRSLAEYDTPDWAPPKAQQWVERPDHRASATRSSASSPPTTAPAAAPSRPSRRPASIRFRRSPATTRRSPALQLIIAGDQYNTISKPSEIVARGRRQGRRAVPAGRDAGGRRRRSSTRPSELFVPAVVTAENLKAEIFDKRSTRPPSSAPAAMPRAARSSASQ